MNFYIRNAIEQLCAASCAEDEARSSGRPSTSSSQADGVQSLLNVLADIYAVYPDLWLNERLRCTLCYQVGYQLLPYRVHALGTRVILSPPSREAGFRNSIY